MAGRAAYDRTTYVQDIKELRRRGLSLQEVADELGISKATVCRILRESRDK